MHSPLTTEMAILVVSGSHHPEGTCRSGNEGGTS